MVSLGDVPVEMLPPRVQSGARIRLLRYPGKFTRISWRDDLPAEFDTHADAVAMPVVEDSQRRVLGAMYDRHGQLIRNSERGKTNRAWSGNAPETPLPGVEIERIEGRTFFAGYLRKSFGHVLLENVTRFWPELDFAKFDTLLFYPQGTRRRTSSLDLPPYARDLLTAAAGTALGPLRMVAASPLRLAEITVSSPVFWLKHGFSPAVGRVFERVGANLAGRAPQAETKRPRRIYLSRSHLGAPARRAGNEVEIEQLVAAAGFAVIHPQELAVTEQVALVRAADAIAGCDGSALHLAVFARPGTRLVALDSRPVPNQFIVDHLSGLDAVHVLATSQTAVHRRRDLWQADLGCVEAALAVAGLS